MNLTEEQLKELESLAAACLKIHEISMILGIDKESFEAELEIENSPIRLAYQKGLLITKFKVNKKIIDLAEAGSSPAQSMAMKLILEVELENVK